MRRFKGLSLLDHRVQLAVGTELDHELATDQRCLGQTLPAALLPIFRGESAIVGPPALAHRRGVGLRWPPEARFHPSGSSPGRIPLATCWGRLFGDTWEQAALNQPFSWELHRGDVCQARPADLLAASALSFANHTPEDDLIVVVPDRLGDGALQILRDSLASEQARRYRGSPERGRVRMLWRSAAMALAWCRRFAPGFEGQGTADEEGEPVGHIALVSLGMDTFEVVVCEVIARRYEGRTWLLPVVDRRYPAGVLGPWGISLLGSLAAEQAGKEGPERVWKRLLQLPEDELAAGAFDRQDLIDVTQIGLTGGAVAVREADSEFESLLPVSDTPGNKESLGHRLQREVRQRQATLAPNCRMILGAVVEGAAGKISLREGPSLNAIFRTFLAKLGVPKERLVIGGGELASVGAARFGWCTATGRPTYRERLQPLEFFATGKDRLGDARAEWTPLLDVQTVEGGRVHRRGDPVKGFHIDAGADELVLILRSTRHGSRPAVRAVPAELEKPVRKNEPVELDVGVEPGQGYAKVEVRSAEPGLFRCVLDWRRMAPSEVPEISLSYVANVFRVESDRQAWRAGAKEAEGLVTGLEGRTSDARLLQLIRVWRGRRLNKHRRDDTDGWLYWSPVGSDGTAPGPAARQLLARINAGLAESYRRTHSDELRKAILSCAGWTFTAMHPKLHDQLQRTLRRVTFTFDRAARRAASPFGGGERLVLPRGSRQFEAACSSVVGEHLTAAGHAFVNESDIGLVFEAARARFTWKMDGTNHWLRALRNLVRYRQHALHPTAVPRPVLDQITERVVQKLQEEVASQKFERILDNCLIILMFLLKRRRYEPDYPRHHRELERLLETITETRNATERQREWASLTLRFLTRRGTGSDVVKFLSLSEAL
jgi:hypothetical protein